LSALRRNTINRFGSNESGINLYKSLYVFEGNNNYTTKIPDNAAD